MNCTVKSRVSFVNHADITALWPSGPRLLMSVRMPEQRDEILLAKAN